ncbi:D-TA family PLP-dependent enzyme [Eubacteriales bacterium OttesenSCG-928-A19]|nr:D-TA family PLP-dependent enzyme [Eubacteriales bacterium OttesenSCG-928-A19]
MIDSSLYALESMETLETPALVFYRDYIETNTQRAIERAGGPQRLWPHVKSHKMRDMILMQQRMGITRFKCATIAEAQMVADCGGEHILLAYPLVGPNLDRYLRLCKAYPASTFYAIGDDPQQLRLLSEASQAMGLSTRTLLDINMGMCRTGVPLDDVFALYVQCAKLPGLRMMGLHCYDGHIHHEELTQRAKLAQSSLEQAHAIRAALRDQGTACELLIMGGTPTFPVHAAHADVFLSPGTVFLGDGKSIRNVAELSLTPAAGVWTRVISHPGEDLFTLDLGVKGISTDQMDGRGILVGLEGAVPQFQSEEHWVYRMPDGKTPPAIGACFFVIPMHICPATALYPYAHVASGGRIVGRWSVTARDRSIGL